MATIEDKSVGERGALGRRLIASGNWEEAEAVFDALIHGGYDDPGNRYLRANARLQLGRIEEGLHDLQDVHTRQPSNESLKALASTLWMQKHRKNC